MTGDGDIVLVKNYENEQGEREFKTLPRKLIQSITPYHRSKKSYTNIDYYLKHFS